MIDKLKIAVKGICDKYNLPCTIELDKNLIQKDI